MLGVVCSCVESENSKLAVCLCATEVTVEVCVYGDSKENVEHYVVCE